MIIPFLRLGIGFRYSNILHRDSPVNEAVLTFTPSEQRSHEIAMD